MICQCAQKPNKMYIICLRYCRRFEHHFYNVYMYMFCDQYVLLCSLLSSPISFFPIPDTRAVKLPFDVSSRTAYNLVSTITFSRLLQRHVRILQIQESFYQWDTVQIYCSNLICWYKSYCNTCCLPAFELII